MAINVMAYRALEITKEESKDSLLNSNKLEFKLML